MVNEIIVEKLNLVQTLAHYLSAGLLKILFFFI